MKSLKSKVILSALVLIFALVATIGSTFAWFTVSNTVATSNISLNVVSTDSLLIKLANYAAVDGDASLLAQTDAANYSTTAAINQTTLSNLGYTTTSVYSLWRLSPVTAIQDTYAEISSNPSALQLLNTAAGPLENPTRLLAGSPVINANAGGVINLKFWVMSQSDANKYLRVSALTIDGDSISPTANLALENSLRLSVYSTLTSSGFVYGNDMDYEFTFTNLNTATWYNGAVYPNAEAPFGTVQGFNSIIDLAHGLDGASTALTSAVILNDVEHGTVGTSNIITLVKNIPQLISTTIFIEGWDADASDLLNTVPFFIQYAFSIYTI